MNPLILLNRDWKLPGDGWQHVVPLGEFPHPSGITQVVDVKAATAIVNRFATDKTAANFPGLLVDFDHFSDDLDKPSEAAGWIDDLQNRADGVWAHIRWSDAGEAAVKGGRYRLVSPVFKRSDAEEIANAKRLRPLRLIKVALTNDPNLTGMVPLSNRAGADAPADNTKPNNTQTKRMKSVCTLLGLSADADETSAHAAVAKLQNRLTTLEPLSAENLTLKNRVSAMETEQTALLDEQVESLLDARGIKTAERRAKIKPVLLTMKNRADRVGFLEEIPADDKGASQQNQLRNRDAKTPGSQANLAGTEQELTAKAESEIAHYKISNRCSYADARNMVRTQKPELFGLAK